MKRTHKIKLFEEFADAVLCGDKTFEVRENDRGYQKGDLVQFNVIDKYSLSTGHPLTKETYRITYVLNGWGIEPKYVVFSIKNVRGEVNDGDVRSDRQGPVHIRGGDGHPRACRDGCVSDSEL